MTRLDVSLGFLSGRFLPFVPGRPTLDEPACILIPCLALRGVRGAEEPAGSRFFFGGGGAGGVQGLEWEHRALGPLGAKMGSEASTDTSRVNTGHLKSFQQCHFSLSC